MKRIFIRLGDNDFHSILHGFAEMLLAAHEYDPDHVESLTRDDVKQIFKAACGGIYLLYNEHSNAKDKDDIESTIKYLQDQIEPIFFRNTSAIPPKETSELFRELWSIREVERKKWTPESMARVEEINRLLAEPQHQVVIDYIYYGVMFDKEIDEFLTRYPTQTDGDAILIDFYTHNWQHM